MHSVQGGCGQSQAGRGSQRSSQAKRGHIWVMELSLLIWQEAEQRKGLLHRFPRRPQEGQKRTWKEDTESCDYVRETNTKWLESDLQPESRKIRVPLFKLHPGRGARAGGRGRLPHASRSREVPCAANRGQRGLRGAGAAARKGHQIVPKKLSRTELLGHEDRQLLLALQRRDVISICSFLDDYRGFATTEEVLDLLFTEYGYIVAACGDDDTVQRWKLAISCMLEIWLDYYGDDFCQLPEFPSLMKILQFVRQHMPGSDVELRARRNLQQFRRLHTVEPEAGASAQGKHPEAAQEQVPALTVGTAAPSGPAGIQAVPAAGAEGSARAEAPAGEVKPLQIVVTALVHCSALEEPPAPAATPEEEQAPAPAIGVPRVPEPPPASGTTGFDP
ncbi:ral guanine nucleotide dissociation stimulator-like isoform X2 [Canis lupus familiaris]|uniref:ral guanine nucleotide dissociation stimulator-like isoform X2 n=1 Tax=Canis lupus familiaris TaxID=9615 RepID=UPI0018F437A6|nr:ral guanine nucleotide dissociation stimulator-like isoform X2 [Canis lupus familiaris]